MQAGRRDRRPALIATLLGSGLRLLALLDRDALVLEQGLQFAGLEHLADDVAAADEFALDVELRNGRPVRVRLDALAQVVVLEHVEPFVGHAEMIEDLHDLPGEAAHRELRRALHEQHHLVRLDLIIDELVDGHYGHPHWHRGALSRVESGPSHRIYVAQGRRKAQLANLGDRGAWARFNAAAHRSPAPAHAACRPFRLAALGKPSGAAARATCRETTRR